jgi:3-isopropylmalate/(R)-2-methylmalate dehydratase small subunit
MRRDRITVDLESRTVDEFPFELDDHSRECLLNGWDDIALTLREQDAIAAYEASHVAPLDTLAV